MKTFRAAAVIAVCISPSSAFAHHEAIFGPQSAMVLTSDAYLTGQLFTRQTGPKDQRVQETTTVLSAGFSPFKKPISVALILPFSVIRAGGASTTGLEDAILGVRYRADLPDLTRAIGGKESFAMVVGGVELPTGTIDHAFGKDSLASIAAGLMSIEKGPFSLIGYGFYRRQSMYKTDREGANLFFGTGVAWTPIDDQAGRLFSVQLGLSHEAKRREHVGGLVNTESGGHGVYAHPTILYGVSQQLMLFAQTTLPVSQDWRNQADHERFRAGAGVILVLRR
jgi:hypothetical protein